MRFSIFHHTQYRYTQSVRLAPHQLRFYPRDDGAQRVIEYQMEISPAPQGRNEHIDLEGNRQTQLWFASDTDHLVITVCMQVETLRRNPYDFILDPGTLSLPVDLGNDFGRARAYLQRDSINGDVNRFASEISSETNHDTLQFVEQLNRKLFDDFNLIHRETGTPQSPAETLHSGLGACRDLTVLFVDCCRAQGLPARFASGYQKGNLQAERRHLHAWPEVYFPGAGWRAFDPTHGEIVADTHITIAAAANPRDTMPVTGNFTGPTAGCRLSYDLKIDVSDNALSQSQVQVQT